MRLTNTTPVAAVDVSDSVGVGGSVDGSVAFGPSSAFEASAGVRDVEIAFEQGRESSDAAERILEGVPIDETVRWLMTHADGSRTVPELASAAPGDEAHVTRAVYGLVLAKVLRPSGSQDEDEPARVLETLTRDQVLGWLTRAEGADYYTVLGLAPLCCRP